MLKIRTKKIVFYDKYVKSTIMVDSFYWNSIGFWIPTHKNLLLALFLIRPILDPKFHIDIFIIKNYLCSYFQHISLCFYSNFEWDDSLDTELIYASNEYPHCILLMDPTPRKMRNTLKNFPSILMHFSFFLG